MAAISFEEMIMLESCEERALLHRYIKALREEMRPFEVLVSAVYKGRLIIEAKAGNAIAGVDLGIEEIELGWDEAIKGTASMLREYLAKAMDDGRFRFRFPLPVEHLTSFRSTGSI